MPVSSASLALLRQPYTPHLAGLPVSGMASTLVFIRLPITARSGQKDVIMQTILVFCHLRWDFVYQRPQHLLTRLAEHFRIIVIEEPVFAEGAPFLNQTHPAPNLTVCRPHTPIHADGFHDDQIAVLQPLLTPLVPAGEEPIVWFYTPMALPLLGALHPGLVIYDCMDELAAFRNAPKQVLQREAALLGIADLVFTGGPSLHAAKRTRHPSVHCFPSSVDAGHFAQALTRDTVHPALHSIAGPRLGYYGVIDERLDLDLIAALATAHPQWQIVMVGPVVKIDPRSLPVAPNLHYLGQQPYAALPLLLAGWDVCLLPFALNDATRFISPTKVLEYMAAELPIVSTAIADVAGPYGHLVAIAHTPAGFVAACEAALTQTPAQRHAQAAAMRAAVATTSWQASVDQMRVLIDQAQQQRLTADIPVAGPVVAESVAGVTQLTPLPLRTGSSTPPLHKCIIIGAGPTGLSAAYHYGAHALLLERNATVGGWCRSIEDGGFTFDHAGHIMFSNDPYVLQLYTLLLGDNLHWQNREAWVYSKQVYTRYPFQGALYGLPPAVITECIVGAMEARFGDLQRQPGVTPAAAGTSSLVSNAPVHPVRQSTRSTVVTDSSTVAANERTDTPAEAVAPDRVAASVPAAGTSANFEEFIYGAWGKGIAKHFAIPYNRKLWTVPLDQMETSWLGGRVPLPDLTQIIEGALQPVARPMGPNARFGYPVKGGFQALMSAFLPHLAGPVETGTTIVGLHPREHLLVLADGRRLHYEHLVSTMPLPELIRMIGTAAPEVVRTAAQGLRHISIRCVNIGVAREAITDKHWIYYPEDAIFHRIFVQGNASVQCNAPGGFGFTCEISYSPWKPLPVDGQALIDRCIADCIAVGMITADDQILVANQVDMPCAYVVYDHARASNVATVKAWLSQHDILLAGRYSEWEYYNSDHAFIAGKKVAETVHDLARSRSVNEAAE